MNVYKFFEWKAPAPTYITCREADVAAFKTIGFVQEKNATTHLAKITRPDSDFIDLLELVFGGATFFGNIESTNESGPALIAAHPDAIVIVPCNDLLQPVIPVLEDGTILTRGGEAYWDAVSVAKTILRAERLSAGKTQKSQALDRFKHELKGFRRLLDRR